MATRVNGSLQEIDGSAEGIGGGNGTRHLAETDFHKKVTS
jgi:hypothetical protein